MRHGRDMLSESRGSPSILKDTSDVKSADSKRGLLSRGCVAGLSGAIGATRAGRRRGIGARGAGRTDLVTMSRSYVARREATAGPAPLSMAGRGYRG
jgi:hypothetical protein